MGLRQRFQGCNHFGGKSDGKPVFLHFHGSIIPPIWQMRKSEGKQGESQREARLTARAQGRWCAAGYLLSEPRDGSVTPLPNP